MKTTRIGLTLGKFAPLHRGHQLLIERALAETEQLIILIYDCPETTAIPLNVRAQWLRLLYPSAKVIEAWDGPTEVGLSDEIKRKHEDYVLHTLKISGVTHFYSSEFYGEHMSKALGAVNCVIDQPRQQVPISATLIRSNPFLYRAYLPPLVYRDMITNVVFLGAPSSGKTTIAARLAQEYTTTWMPEYGREYWEKHQQDRRLSLEQLVEIAEGHIEREEALLYEAKTYLFTDTNALTTLLFSMAYHHSAASQLIALANQASTRYDLVFVCDIDIPYDDTWDRSGDLQRHAFQKRIIADLIARKIPFFVLSGDLETRVRLVKKILERHPKYQNILRPFLERTK